MRGVTERARRDLYAETGREVWVILLTIDHPSLAEPIRVCSDEADLTSRGALYVAYPFELSLPDDVGDRLVRAQIRIDNVARDITAALRGAAAQGEAPSVTVEIVRASDPDSVEAGPWQFLLRNARYDALSIEGELAFENLLELAFPAHAFVPSLFPGLF